MIDFVVLNYIYLSDPILGITVREL
jgi:hypothetical protein